MHYYTHIYCVLFSILKLHLKLFFAFLGLENTLRSILPLELICYFVFLGISFNFSLTSSYAFKNLYLYFNLFFYSRRVFQNYHLIVFLARSMCMHVCVCVCVPLSLYKFVYGPPRSVGVNWQRSLPTRKDLKHTEKFYVFTVSAIPSLWTPVINVQQLTKNYLSEE